MNSKRTGRTCVVLADTARARIFTLESRPGPGGRCQRSLEERRDLSRSGGGAFAVDVARGVRDVARERGTRGVIVVAAPRLLGRLRKQWEPSEGLDVLYVGLELATNTPAEALERLSKAGYFPEGSSERPALQ